jgi:hypothetical protein
MTASKFLKNSNFINLKNIMAEMVKVLQYTSIDV